MSSASPAQWRSHHDALPAPPQERPALGAAAVAPGSGVLRGLRLLGGTAMIDVGRCNCGCGAPTAIATRNDRLHGSVKGVPRRYIAGHSLRMRVFPHWVDRFWAKVNKNGPIPSHNPALGPCHEWTGARTKGGYGHLRVDGKMRIASRLAWELANGPIPPGLDALHHCDNRPCVNAEHLHLGDDVDNSRDCFSRGRWARLDRSGERNGRAKLSKAKADEIRTSYRRGHITRHVLAEKHGVAVGTIGDVLAGRRWP